MKDTAQGSHKVLSPAAPKFGSARGGGRGDVLVSGVPDGRQREMGLSSLLLTSDQRTVLPTLPAAGTLDEPVNWFVVLL
ncbi:hypothetical protein AAFF_G00001360 [Aldrovandia affinis]|uniref:Uncharacterized protein n=1 Tax=Aldrovandia affinis TaxID=143900 RepID=A0AAD7TCW0_9TELE|nr:hypothetical protein AAFF_G00001360 [Aldrovandia affinis]